MRTLSTVISNYVNTQKGNAQPMVVSVEWEDGTWTDYEDEIVSLTELNEVLTPLEVVNGQVSVTIHDPAYAIRDKSYHKRPAIVKLKVDNGVDPVEYLPLFYGKVSSPFEIEEKQITFSIVNEIETMEIGFSPDEGQLDFVPREKASQVWPLGFGTVLNQPTLEVSQPLRMVLETGFISPDPMLYYKLLQAQVTMADNLIERNFFLGTIAQNEDLVGTLAAQFVAATNSVRTYTSQLQAYIDDVKDAQQALDKNAKDAGLIAALAVAETAYRNFMLASETAAAILANIKKVLEKKLEKRKIRKDAANKVLQLIEQERQLYTTIVNLGVEICNQERYNTRYLRVNNSRDWPQNTEVDVFINNIRYKAFVDNKDLYLSEGPLPLYTTGEVVVKAWAPDDEAVCDPVLESINMFRCDTNLEGQWILCEATNTTGLQRHMLKVVKQVGDKVYFQLVEWSADRFRQLPSRDIQQMIEATVALNDPDRDTKLDPTLWNRRETARYLQIIAGISGGLSGTVTEEEKRVAATIAYLEPWDVINEALLTLEVPSLADAYTVLGMNITSITEVAGVPLLEWFSDYEWFFEEMPSSLGLNVEPGTEVVEAMRKSIHIVNCLPSTIYGVFAYKTNTQGQRYLSPVPSFYYEKLENHNLGTLDITALLVKPLPSTWDKQLYVTYKSSVGPRLMTILQHLTDNYTDKDWDVSSFNKVQNQLGDKYPLGFYTAERRNVIDFINQLAWESRCRVWLQNDKYHIEYLSAQPRSIRDLTGIVINSRVHSTQETPDLITLYTSNWRQTYLPDGFDEKIILRYNSIAYGIKPKDVTYITFQDYDLIYKTAVFWLLRESNTFRRIKVETVVKNIDLQIGDFVRFENQTCEIIESSYNRNTLTFTLQLPVRLGETTKYPYYWPSTLPFDSVWPPPFDTGAKGFGPNSDVQGTIDNDF